MMKPVHYLQNAAVIFFLIASAAPLMAVPMATAATAKLPPPKSVFVMPTDPKEGRDPFFPNSERPYESTPGGVKNLDNSALQTLKVKSIIETEHGRVFAIINNHAFAPGDEGTVISDDGQRVNIRCLDINAKANTVTVESNGARATLIFSDKP